MAAIGDRISSAWGFVGRVVGKLDVMDQPSPCVVLGGIYQAGGAAFVVNDAHGQPYTSVSVRIADTSLEPGEFVLHHDVNDDAALADALLRACFTDTGKRVSYGFITDAPVWRLADAAAVALADVARDEVM